MVWPEYVPMALERILVVVARGTELATGPQIGSVTIGEQESLAILGTETFDHLIERLAVQLVCVGILAELTEHDAEMPLRDQNVPNVMYGILFPILDEPFHERPAVP